MRVMGREEGQKRMDERKAGDRMERKAQAMPAIQWKDPVCPGMRLRERAAVPYLTLPAFDALPGIRHAFSTRLGGVSRGDVGTMNLGFSREADRENVRENLSRFAAAAGFAPEKTEALSQVHSSRVVRVTGEVRHNRYVGSDRIEEADGMVTDLPGVALHISVADCVPVMFADARRRVVGLSHAGWRGTLGGIVRETLRVMRDGYGCAMEDILVGIGPSICQDCYEVSADVADSFRAVFEERDWPRILAPGRKSDKAQLNLWEANALMAEAEGIRREQIHIGGLCTCCNPDLLFSHRASKGRRGNLGAFICLEDTQAQRP